MQGIIQKFQMKTIIESKQKLLHPKDRVTGSKVTIQNIFLEKLLAFFNFKCNTVLYFALFCG